jgi:hypothetical protein
MSQVSSWATVELCSSTIQDCAGLAGAAQSRLGGTHSLGVALGVVLHPTTAIEAIKAQRLASIEQTCLKLDPPVN